MLKNSETPADTPLKPGWRGGRFCVRCSSHGRNDMPLESMPRAKCPAKSAPLNHSASHANQYPAGRLKPNKHTQ